MSPQDSVILKTSFDLSAYTRCAAALSVLPYPLSCRESWFRSNLRWQGFDVALVPSTQAVPASKKCWPRKDAASPVVLAPQICTIYCNGDNISLFTWRNQSQEPTSEPSCDVMIQSHTTSLEASNSSRENNYETSREQAAIFHPVSREAIVAPQRPARETSCDSSRDSI
jgi:hypothetical protein